MGIRTLHAEAVVPGTVASHLQYRMLIGDESSTRRTEHAVPPHGQTSSDLYCHRDTVWRNCQPSTLTALDRFLSMSTPNG
jgi:hypothetical protein